MMRELLRRCLDRDVKTRLRDIGEARIAVDRPREAAPVVSVPVEGKRRVLPWAVALAVMAGLAGAGWWRATRPMDRPLMWLSVDLGPDGRADRDLTAAISPDGTRLVFPVGDAGAS